MNGYKPLNPALYGQLKKRFGDVRVVNQGVALTKRRHRDPLSGRDRVDVETKGEYYVVNCPFCGDTRKRLYINHSWGKRDDRGSLNLWLCVCWNDTRCMDDPRRRSDFYEDLNTPGVDLAVARIRPGKPAPEVPDEVEWPGNVTRVHLLSRDHPGRRYLEKRYFDCELLGRVYGVSWCEESRFMLANRRIIIPVFDAGKLRYWQARYPGELNWKDKSNPPKYYNTPHVMRGGLIYNFDQASRYETLVVCEGVADVWAFGPMAVSLFGCRVDETQKRRILAKFEERTLVLLLDPDKAGESGARSPVVAEIRKRMAGRFCRVQLPPGKDPADFDRDFLHDYVAGQAADQGVTVSYDRAE